MDPRTSNRLTIPIAFTAAVLIGCTDAPTGTRLTPEASLSVAIEGLRADVVAYYTMDGNLNDISGNAFHGTMGGTLTSTTDRFNKPNSALQFNGIDAVGILPGEPTDNKTRGAINLWLKPVLTSDPLKCGRPDHVGISPYACQYNVFAKQDVADVPTFRAQYGTLSGQPGDSLDSFYFMLSGEQGGFTSSPLADLSGWHMYTFTWDGSNKKTYFDGRLVSSNANSSSSASSGALYLGSNSTVGSSSDRERFEGAMDDVSIFDRELRPVEVKALLTLRRIH